jgi:hypothetical protein
MASTPAETAFVESASQARATDTENTPALAQAHCPRLYLDLGCSHPFPSPSTHAASSQSTLVNHSIPLTPALPSLVSDSATQPAQNSPRTTESSLPAPFLPTIYSRPPTISSYEANSAADPAVDDKIDEKHDVSSVKDSPKHSVAPAIVPVVSTPNHHTFVPTTAGTTHDPQLLKQQARSLGSSLESNERRMVRIGIRWQLAGVVLLSSLVGLAVIAIATWVSLISTLHCGRH